jgi:hypothetical protein
MCRSGSPCYRRFFLTPGLLIVLLTLPMRSPTIEFLYFAHTFRRLSCSIFCVQSRPFTPLSHATFFVLHQIFCVRRPRNIHASSLARHVDAIWKYYRIAFCFKFVYMLCWAMLDVRWHRVTGKYCRQFKPVHMNGGQLQVEVVAVILAHLPTLESKRRQRLHNTAAILQHLNWQSSNLTSLPL